jgi:hypothetical protein
VQCWWSTHTICILYLYRSLTASGILISYLIQKLEDVDMITVCLDFISSERSSITIIHKIFAVQNHKHDCQPQFLLLSTYLCAYEDLGCNPLLYRVELIDPRCESTCQLPNLLARQHTRLHPGNLCSLVDLIQRATDQFQAAQIELKEGWMRLSDM